MSEPGMNELTRRDFLGKAVVMAGAMPFVPGLNPFARTTLAAPAANYRSLTPKEATFTEVLVNVLCPADKLTPNGVTCGLATFIDRELAGEFGAQPSSQRPLSKEEFFKNGVAAVNQASRERFGVPFDRLNASDAGVFWAGIVSGRVRDSGVSLASWYKEIVDPLLVQASFSGPIYGKYDNNVFLKVYA